MQFPTEKPRWGLLDLSVILLLIIGTSFIYSWVQPFIYFTLVYNYGFSDSVTTEFLLDFTVQFIITLGAVALVIGWYRRTPLAEMGFKPVAGRTLAVYGFGWGILIFAVVMLVGAVIQSFVPVPPQDFENVLKDAGMGWEKAAIIVIGVFFGPFYEEVFFRGIIYPVCRARLGVGVGIAVSAVIFSLVHVDVVRFLPLFAGGVGLAYLYEKTGSIYTAWAAHGTWNLIMALSLLINI